MDAIRRKASVTHPRASMTTLFFSFFRSLLPERELAECILENALLHVLFYIIRVFRPTTYDFSKQSLSNTLLYGRRVAKQFSKSVLLENKHRIIVVSVDHESSPPPPSPTRLKNSCLRVGRIHWRRA